METQYDYCLFNTSCHPQLCTNAKYETVLITVLPECL